MSAADIRYSILHPTDYSVTSAKAFAHALRLAVLTKGELRILHVNSGKRNDPEDDFYPSVRTTLARWGLLPGNAPREAVHEQLGVFISKVGVRDRHEADGVGHFLERNGADLVVLGTHGRDGIDHALHGSIAEDIASRTDVPALFVPSDSAGFVDVATGELSLRRVLVPVSEEPPAGPALDALAPLLGALALGDGALDVLHVGEAAPVVETSGGGRDLPVRLVQGDAVEGILQAASQVDLVVMPTQQRDSFLDSLRGTMTERIVRRSPCPVLAVPTAPGG